MQGSANLNVMIKAARKAGRSLVKDFREVENLQVSIKGRGRLREPADIAAETIIREELMGARPTYGWLAEEGRRGRGQGPDPALDRRSAGRHHELPARHAALGGVDRAGAQGRDRGRRDLRPGQGRDVLCREGRRAPG
jgi:3'-phosphoadenosine 5'-phosphosulfate (PAPS) 3'-phosphatase